MAARGARTRAGTGLSGQFRVLSGCSSRPNSYHSILRACYSRSGRIFGRCLTELTRKGRRRASPSLKISWTKDDPDTFSPSELRKVKGGIGGMNTDSGVHYLVQLFQLADLAGYQIEFSLKKKGRPKSITQALHASRHQRRNYFPSSIFPRLFSPAALPAPLRSFSRSFLIPHRKSQPENGMTHQ